jgi:hypothetical protein
MQTNSVVSNTFQYRYVQLSSPSESLSEQAFSSLSVASIAASLSGVNKSAKATPTILGTGFESGWVFENSQYVPFPQTSILHTLGIGSHGVYKVACGIYSRKNH